jgi:formyl-CoA transferase
MKALFVRAATGEGSRIDMSMFESTCSWLTVPITMTKTFGKKITRRGNTHEFFAPVSVYPTSDGHVYVAVGNDKQFQALASLPEFAALNKEDYKKNIGRIGDVENINNTISEITKTMTTDQAIATFNKIGVAISKINSVGEVADDPLVSGKLVKAKDKKSGFELTLAPPPFGTDFLRESSNQLSFPPRFGEHNEAVFGETLGISLEDLKQMKDNGVI